MAIVTTTFSVEAGNVILDRQGYIGVGDEARRYTSIPRGEINFSIKNGAIALTGVGDSQELNINCTLPPGYAYVIEDISIFKLAGVDGDAWESNAECRVINSPPRGAWTQAFDLRSPGEYFQTSTTSAKSFYIPYNPFQRVMVPQGSCNLFIALFNGTTNQSAMTFNFLARFWVFDVEQSYSQGINWPIPTR